MADLFTISLVFSTIRLSTPLVLAALGGMFSERSGVINIALEGMMLAGAFTAAAMTYSTGSPSTGLAAAIGAGLLVALIHAVACIRYKADQVVVGTAINILMLGLPGFLSGAFFLSSGSTPQIPIEQLIPRVPIVLAFALVPITWYVLNRTPFGLRLRAVGENPEAADAAGINVARMRYSGVLLSGALAAITAAVVGVVLNLTVWFALHVLFPAVTEMRAGPLRWYAFDPLAIDVKVTLLAIVAALLAFVLHRGLVQLVAIMAALGIAVRLLS